MNDDLLITALRDLGVATSAQIQQRLGKSQATVSRLLRAADAGIVRFGERRSARYAVPELIWGLPAQQALYWGDHQRWGNLTFLVGNRVHIEAPGIDLVTQGELPWFLDHFNLQGFLGRAWAQQLSFGPNPESWTLAQTLYANCHNAYDPPGAISLGEPSGEIVSQVSADLKTRRREYDRYAEDVNATLPAGSSAGGEQPKFLVTGTSAGNAQELKRLIVKFSPPRGTPFGERWHDLLHAETLALRVLNENGIAAAETRIVESAKRTYLESVRFDRVGVHDKLHMVPLSAVHRAFVHGPQRNWAESCDVLAKQQRLPKDDARRARLLLEFGRLTGNSDMHFGNLSLFAPDPAAGRFTLAPVYDMLPMRYRPDMHRDELGYTPLTAPPATPGHEAIWAGALALARTFWQRLAAETSVSADLRKISRLNLAALPLK